jgi:exosome complex RNA-binding protein Rrp42 (RNase PH superfamily)
VFGGKSSEILISIKAKVVKMPDSETTDGIEYFLESTQTGQSLFVKEADAQKTRALMLEIINKGLRNILTPAQLCISSGESAWHLSVDILVMEELSLAQL